jgi:riboflavin synthase
VFTGIVEEIGKVKSIVGGSNSIKLSIECEKIIEGTKLGDSIAVNGICLTVTEISGSSFTADVMPETMRRTNLNKLAVSQKVNLERALRLFDRLGGHIVSGHIDGIGTLINKIEEDNAIWLTIEANESIMKYIIIKGSVALDGTSLTVARIFDSGFEVSLIPLTAGITTLGSKKIGDEINIECDIVGKYIEKMLNHGNSNNGKKSDISMDFLIENGFA